MQWLPLVAALAASGVTLAYAVTLGVPPVPARRTEVDAALELLQAESLSHGARVVELGAGWGGLALRVARALPHVQVVGYELSPLPYLVARLRASRVLNCNVYRRDFHRVDLGEADAITAFLMMRPMERLEAKFDRELAAGTPVVAIGFQMRGRAARKTRCGGDVALYRWPSGSTRPVPSSAGS